MAVLPFGYGAVVTEDFAGERVIGYAQFKGRSQREPLVHGCVCSTTYDVRPSIRGIGRYVIQRLCHNAVQHGNRPRPDHSTMSEESSAPIASTAVVDRDDDSPAHANFWTLTFGSIGVVYG